MPPEPERVHSRARRPVALSKDHVCCSSIDCAKASLTHLNDGIAATLGDEPVFVVQIPAKTKLYTLGGNALLVAVRDREVIALGRIQGYLLPRRIHGTAKALDEAAQQDRKGTVEEGSHLFSEDVTADDLQPHPARAI